MRFPAAASLALFVHRRAGTLCGFVAFYKDWWKRSEGLVREQDFLFIYLFFLLSSPSNCLHMAIVCAVRSILGKTLLRIIAWTVPIRTTLLISALVMSSQLSSAFASTKTKLFVLFFHVPAFGSDYCIPRLIGCWANTVRLALHFIDILTCCVHGGRWRRRKRERE